jgi:hypothetical protein
MTVRRLIAIPHVHYRSHFNYMIVSFSRGSVQHKSTWLRRPLTGLLYQPQMTDEYGAFGAMRNGKGDWSTRRKHAPVPLCPPQIQHDLTWGRTQATAAGSRRLTAWAMALSERMSTLQLRFETGLFNLIVNLRRYVQSYAKEQKHVDYLVKLFQRRNLVCRELKLSRCLYHNRVDSQFSLYLFGIFTFNVTKHYRNNLTFLSDELHALQNQQ